jgi:sugar phosphate isomerase/epimerase
LAETLKKVADIGYKTVQLSGVCKYDPVWMKEQLDKNGLRCVLTHVNFAEASVADLIADHNVLNCDCIGLGGYGAFWKKDDEAVPLEQIVPGFKAEYGPIAEEIYKGGKYFMYHNHDHEFIKLDGKTILERMAEDIPAEHMGITLDTYWVQMGGGNPCEWLEKLSGRVECIHLKDLEMVGMEQRMAPIGQGNLNFEKIIESAKKAGTKYALVEQDYCYDKDPFECLEISYNNLKKYF